MIELVSAVKMLDENKAEFWHFTIKVDGLDMVSNAYVNDAGESEADLNRYLTAHEGELKLEAEKFMAVSLFRKESVFELWKDIKELKTAKEGTTK